MITLRGMLGIPMVFPNFVYGLTWLAGESKKYQKKEASLSSVGSRKRTPLLLPLPPSVAHPPLATSVAHPLSHSSARVPATGEEERVLLSLPHSVSLTPAQKISGTGEDSHRRLRRRLSQKTSSPLMPLKQKTQVLEWVLNSKRVIVVAGGRETCI
jgi:hypothetical protein